MRIGYNAIDLDMNTVCVTELAHPPVGCYAISETIIVIIIIIIMLVSEIA